MKKQQNLIQKEEEHVRKLRDTYAQKYPLTFGLGATFGFVSILYGFEKIIDRIDLFANNPWILLAFGLVILSITGTLYNKIR